MAYLAKLQEGATRTPLEQLIEEINFQRAKEMRQILKDESGFMQLHGTAYWTDLFVRHFLFEDGRSAQETDDLLFFIRKRHLKEARKYIPRYETVVEVFRRDSKKLPIGDPEIDWEETIYTNVIIHQYDYYITLAVCTRTSPRQLQVLKRHTERVWASPSRRQMSDKGTAEEMTYPDICFMLDNFDEIFSDILVRDGEMVAVELVARDRDGCMRGVVFLGSVRYEALKKVYDARASISTKMAQRMTFGLFSSPTAQRMEYVRVRGPLGKGHAEMAVTKPPGADCETPTSEPGFMLTDQVWDSDMEDDDDDDYMFQKKHRRRLSDPSANFNSFMYSNFRTKPRDVGKARSESEGLNNFQDQCNEIEAGDVRDGAVTEQPTAAGGAPSVQVGASSPHRPAPTGSQPPLAAGLQDTADAETEASSDERTASQSSRLCFGLCGGQRSPEFESLDASPGRELCDTVNYQVPPNTESTPAEATLPAEVPVEVPASSSVPPEGQSVGEDTAGICPPPDHQMSCSAPESSGVLLQQRCEEVPSCRCRRTRRGTVVHYRCRRARRPAPVASEELDDGAYNPIWTMRGFSQTFHFWKESRRASSLPLRAYVTYVMLPWHAIVNDLITRDQRQEPILTF